MPAMVGWTHVAAGRVEEGLEMLKAGVVRAARAGVAMFLPIFHCRIAEVSLSCDRLAEAAHQLTEAQTLVERTGEANYVADLRRLQGVVALRLGHPEEAEQRLQQGLAAAREQGAHMLELRVATIYGELLAARGDKTEGAAMLSCALDACDTSPGHPDTAAARKALARVLGGGDQPMGGQRLRASPLRDDR
jgi:predicted ATPase